MSEVESKITARFKGKTESALMKLPFRQVYNFRPGFMMPTAGLKNAKPYYSSELLWSETAHP